MTVHGLKNNTNISFSGKLNYKKDLPKIKSAIKKTLPTLESPSKFTPKTRVDYIIHEDMQDRLSCVRTILQTVLKKGNVQEYFFNLIELPHCFRIANCAEMAEIAKIALKLNGIKKSDIFHLYAQKTNGKYPPRSLDHTITAINIASSKNNKKHPKLFEPYPNTRILDLWLDKDTTTIKDLRKYSDVLEIQPDEKLLLMPIKTLEPDKNTITFLKKQFPSLVIK